MKVIDLLNKIANGEEVPKKIKYKNAIYTIRDDKDDYTSESAWFTDSYDYLELNDELEIIEEDKKIEKLTIGKTLILVLTDEIGVKASYSDDYNTLANKINEIIDYLEEKDNE